VEVWGWEASLSGRFARSSGSERLSIGCLDPHLAEIGFESDSWNIKLHQIPAHRTLVIQHATTSKTKRRDAIREWKDSLLVPAYGYIGDTTHLFIVFHYEFGTAERPDPDGITKCIEDAKSKIPQDSFGPDHILSFVQWERAQGEDKTDIKLDNPYEKLHINAECLPGPLANRDGRKKKTADQGEPKQPAAWTTITPKKKNTRQKVFLPLFLLFFVFLLFLFFLFFCFFLFLISKTATVSLASLLQKRNRLPERALARRDEDLQLFKWTRKEGTKIRGVHKKRVCGECPKNL
jgi:hypothetical protein